MRALPTISCLLAVSALASRCFAEPPVITADVYGLVGELNLDRLYFHGSGSDGNGVRSVDATGRSLGLTGGTYYGGGMMMRFAALSTRLGSLMLGSDVAGGGGNVLVGRTAYPFPPGNFGVVRASVDASWAFASRWLLLSYGVSFGGRAVFVTLGGLPATDDAKQDAEAVNFGTYVMTWFRPAILFARFDGGAVYAGANLMIDPIHPGFREYGLSIGVAGL